MVRIVSDTSTLYSTAQAEAAGFSVSPLSVTIAGKSYREFDEISAEEFVAIIRQGHMPTSSQPAIGEVEDLYNRYDGEEILNVAMAAGLSGTYNSAVAAAELCGHPENVSVVNTRTLCGPPPPFGGEGRPVGQRRRYPGKDRGKTEQSHGHRQKLSGARGF